MPPKELTPSTKVRVAKMIVLPPRSECVVPVQCAAPGLRFLQARLWDNATGLHMAVELFEFEACLRVSAFQFTRGSALYRELF
jgi:hypothetical protein